MNVQQGFSGMRKENVFKQSLASRLSTTGRLIGRLAKAVGTLATARFAPISIFARQPVNAMKDSSIMINKNAFIKMHVMRMNATRMKFSTTVAGASHLAQIRRHLVPKSVVLPGANANRDYSETRGAFVSKRMSVSLLIVQTNRTGYRAKVAGRLAMRKEKVQSATAQSTGTLCRIAFLPASATMD